ncbi:hypothetical protein ACFY05_01720 [Microtetraspora fusca]|uniref:Uncharacterized protein n=1 Tax=Microtetraspora fusca TaxID=1997 RepID=A0ABW6UWX1_MICFU
MTGVITMTGMDGMPPSCTLPTTEQPLRVAEWDAVFTERLSRVSRPDPLRLRLDFGSGTEIEGQVRDPTERETRCCSLFTFTLTADRGAVLPKGAVEQAHAPVLDAPALPAPAAGEAR